MSARPDKPVGYVRTFSRNTDFRRLFIGQLVSQTGDWFNTVALYTLLLSLSGSGEAIAYILIIKLLPIFFLSPVAGVAADRFNRKTIMILSDIIRGFVVLGFLFVNRPNQIWIIYLLTGLEVIVSAFFEPAKSASIPNIVPEEELISANALSSASWSVTLAVGAALGGVVTDVLGRHSAFIIDSISFFVSAMYIWFVRIPPATRRPATPGGVGGRRSMAHAFGLTDVIDGLRYLKSNLDVGVLLMAKTGWGLGGGVLLLLTIFGKKVFPIGRDGGTSIGLFYAARGLGAAIGPVLSRPLSGESAKGMKKGITAAFFVSALFYLLFARSTGFVAALLFVIGAHAGGSIQWTYSTTLLQITVPDKYRGRVFALDMALLTLAMSLSTYLTGWGMDHLGLSERTLAAIMGGVFVIPGFGWVLYMIKTGRKDRRLLVPAQGIESPAPETSFPPT
ncbi:MAG TPA: MFS transporter [Blastocatellia bacterium]|nr:MFS transporter [Blastocatellia bacterium]